MKAAVTFMLAALLVLLAAFAAPAAMFRDVPTDSWVYKALDNLELRTNPYRYPDFPGYTYTRYEAAMMVARALERLEDDALMAKVDYDTALQLLALTAEFRPELTEIGIGPDKLKPQVTRLADEKLFIPLIGE